MYTPKRLWLRNVMSHKDSEFVFENGKAVMVQGINLSDDGQLSNGSGKSAILEGISIAIRGNTLRDISAKDLVRDGQKSCIVEMELLNSIDQKTLKIRRTIFSNTKSAELMITVDGEIPKQLSVNSEEKVDVREGNDWIIYTIGVSKEDLLNYFLISKEKYTAFLNMSDGPKKEVIGRFSKSNLLDPVYGVISEKVSKVEKQIRDLQDGVVACESRIQVYKEQLESENVEEKEKKKQQKIDSYREKISQANQVLDQEKKLLPELQATLKEAEEIYAQKQSALKKMDHTAKINLLNKHRALIKSQGKELRQELKEIENLKLDLEKAIHGAVECPECKAEFSISDDSFDVKKSRENLDEFDKAIKEVERDIDEKVSEYNTIDGKIEKLQQEASNAKQSAMKAETATIEAQHKIKNKEITIASQLQSISNWLNSIQNVHEEVVKDMSDEVTEKIEQQEVQIKTYQDQLENLDHEIFQHKEWNGVMTKFKTHLSNKAIAVIEAHCNEYLGRMKTNLQVKLEGYKINRSGDIRENITAKVLRDGIEVGLFGKFSSGEKARIQIAMIFSLQRLINMNSEGGGLDLCFLDEVIESVDSEGIEGIMNTLNGLEETIVVVTHGTFNKNYPNITEVKKVKGISIINQ